MNKLERRRRNMTQLALTSAFDQLASSPVGLIKMLACTFIELDLGALPAGRHKQGSERGAILPKVRAGPTI